MTAADGLWLIQRLAQGNANVAAFLRTYENGGGMNEHEMYERTVKQFTAVLNERDALLAQVAALRVQVAELVAERDALRAELKALADFEATEGGWLFSVSPARDDALDDDLEDTDTLEDV